MEIKYHVIVWLEVFIRQNKILHVYDEVKKTAWNFNSVDR